MKKLSFLATVALAAVSMVSCGSRYEAKNVELTSVEDSLSYAFGMSYGSGVRGYYLKADTTAEAINEFVAAFEKTLKGEQEELSEVAQMGQQFGKTINMQLTDGLANIKAWKCDEAVLLQGFVNGLYQAETEWKADDAMAYFQTHIQAASQANNDLDKAVKGKAAKCPTAAKAVVLQSEIDSLNYALGYINGNEILKYQFSNDSTGEQKKELIKNINIGLNDKSKYPRAAELGKNIGTGMKQQVEKGMFGDTTLTCNQVLLIQGLVNGLYQYDKVMTATEANEYINSTMNERLYGENRRAGEAFLAENATKEGVVVTESGLQYKVVKQGKGAKPSATDKVKVHYHGTLIDGTVFDSSVDRGEPISFPLNGVIKGWTEGLQLMPVGSKYILYIPYQLAYGEQKMPGSVIEPYSALIFEVELLDIEK